MTSRTTGRALAAALTAVVALGTSGLVAPASAATSTGGVKGVVTVKGAPVSFARVQVYRTVVDLRSGENVVKPTRVKTDNTDRSGRYSLSGLTVRSGYLYSVVVTDRPGRLVKESRGVTLKKGRTVTKNVHMSRAGILRGRVTTSDGRSPAGLTVSVPVETDGEGRDYMVFFPDGSTTVRADGTFTLSGLPSGRDGMNDEVRVSDGPYARQCYDFVAGTLADCSNGASPAYQRQRITLAEGEQRTLPTVTVSRFAPAASRLTGTVTDTAGHALKGIAVSVYAEAESSAVTRSSGRFTIDDGLPAGSYVVRFNDPDNKWASRYLGGGPVVITPGRPIGGLDTALKSLSTAKIATKAGKGSAKVAFRIKRKVTGSAPGGTLTLSFGDVSRTVTVRKGAATVTLTGIPKGRSRSLVADYSGTASTAGFHKIVRVDVR
jgi:hypothetical protein